MYGDRYLHFPPAAGLQRQTWLKIPLVQGEVIQGLARKTNDSVLKWEEVQPYFASLARKHFKLTVDGARDQDLEYILAYVGYQSLWFSDDTHGRDYDWNAALVDLASLEDALRRIKGRIIVANHPPNDAPPKSEVLDNEEAAYAEWALWNGMCVPGALTPTKEKVIPQAEEIEL